MNTQTQKAARSAGQQRLAQLGEAFTFHFGQNLRTGNATATKPGDICNPRVTATTHPGRETRQSSKGVDNPLRAGEEGGV